MKQGPEANGGRESRLLRALVRLYPRAFRERFGDDVLRTLGAAHRAASASGARGRVAFWLRNVPDLIVGAVRERIGGSGGRQEKEAGMRSSKTGVVSWLDFKLGFRMLAKYPGLTVVGGLAMAFAICAGTVTFQMVSLFVNPTLPLPDGDRIVQIRNWDVAANDPEPRALNDFLVWREALRSVTDLGAYRDVTRNLIASDGAARPVEVAEITASAFRIATDPPLLGRVLVAADERAGAPPVVVLGYDVWQTRFAGDGDVVGRTVQLGDTYATVVGVMPDGFAFPVSHELWTPLRPDVLDPAPRAGPGITVFGRLAPGATLREAQAELAALGRRAAAERPDTHEHLAPRVVPYAKASSDFSGEEVFMFSIYFFPVMLLVLVCSNVALLLFARAATRESELVVRSALGASRSRIVMQLFAEALVLGGVAAAAGLAAAGFALRQWGLEYLEVNMGRLPFWFDVDLSPATVLYAGGLAVLGAAIAGVLPALKVTRSLGSRLKEGTAGGGGGVRFGGVWTALIVTQVAVTVAAPAVVYNRLQLQLRIRSSDAGFPAEEYLAVQLEMDAPTATGADDEATRAVQRESFAAALETLRHRVAAEPGVAGVTFVDQLPRTSHPDREIELDDASVAPARDGVAASTAGPPPLREVDIASIDPSYFDVLEAPMLAGRAFHAGDLAPDARAVIVDQGFVDQVLLGRNAIGRRLRFADIPPDGRTDGEPRPWYEIVGVVKELGMGGAVQSGRAAGLYFPAAPGSAGEVNMLVHVRGDPMSLGPRVRAIATAVDPTLRLSNFQRLDEVTNGILWFAGLWVRITLLLTGIALLLSFAGIYAVVSVTVARRTREIGVRVALGASPRRVVAALFRRPLTQVGLGVVAGGALIAAGALLLSRGPDAWGTDAQMSLSLGQLTLIVAYSALMFGVCLLACVVPTRRALSVEPTEALQGE